MISWHLCITVSSRYKSNQGEAIASDDCDVIGKDIYTVMGEAFRILTGKVPY